MNRQDAQEILASAQAGDPAAWEFVIATICEHLLQTDYERTVAFLHEQCLALTDGRHHDNWN